MFPLTAIKARRASAEVPFRRTIPLASPALSVIDLHQPKTREVRLIPQSHPRIAITTSITALTLATRVANLVCIPTAAISPTAIPGIRARQSLVTHRWGVRIALSRVAFPAHDAAIASARTRRLRSAIGTLGTERTGTPFDGTNPFPCALSSYTLGIRIRAGMPCTRLGAPATQRPRLEELVRAQP